MIDPTSALAQGMLITAARLPFGQRVRPRRISPKIEVFRWKDPVGRNEPRPGTAEQQGNDTIRQNGRRLPQIWGNRRVEMCELRAKPRLPTLRIHHVGSIPAQTAGMRQASHLRDPGLAPEAEG